MNNGRTVYKRQGHTVKKRQGHTVKKRQGHTVKTVLVNVWFIFHGTVIVVRLSDIIIHQTHYKKSDWSRAFSQFTTVCELDMINAISAADSAFIKF